MNFKGYDFFSKEDLKFLYETYNYKTIGELLEGIEKRQLSEEERKEQEIEDLMLSMHKHKREEKKEKQESMGCRRNPFKALFDEEILIRYAYPEEDELD